MSLSRGQIDVLIHDVNSKCANLKGAAAMMRQAPPERADELLSMMASQARKLADDLADLLDKRSASK